MGIRNGQSLPDGTRQKGRGVQRKWNRTGEVQVEATVPVEGSGCEVPDPSGQGQCISESADGQIREALPVPGVHVILGNILAGARVWPSGPAPPVLSIEPIEANKQGDWVTEVPKDCTAGVTGAKSRAQSGRGSNRISGLKCEKKSGLIGWCVCFSTSLVYFCPVIKSSVP